MSKKTYDMPKPKVPTLVRDYPVASAAISKVTEDNNKKTVNPLTLNLPEIAFDTSERIRNNETIVQLFPDTELCIQILTSSILSPNDLLTTSLVYDLPDNVKIPSGVKQLLTEAVRTHIDTNYGLESKLNNILRESLFTKGAYIEAIIPEASVDDIINRVGVGSVSLESLDKVIATNEAFNSLGYLSDNKSSRTLSKEDFKSLTNLDNANDIVITEQELSVEIIDNPNFLLLGEYIKSTKKERSKKTVSLLHKRMSSKQISIEEIDTVFKQSSSDGIFKNINKTNKTTEYIEVKTRQDASRESIGKPMCMKLPVEAVIPVHIKDAPDQHLGYFIPLDTLTGTPINGEEESLDVSQSYHTSTSGTDSKLELINKAKNALYGITKKEPKLSDVENIYSHVLEGMIKDKLKGGMFGDIADIKDCTSLYRVMFTRALKNKRTRLLFIPNELVAYYAFDYRENGTGKSLLEKVSVLYSIRAILLFTRLMANSKNAVSITDIKATLDEHDVDPQKSIEKIMSESLKTRQTLLPLGVTKVDDLVNWVHRAGFRYNIKHPSLPDMEIDSSDVSSSKTVPDTDLDDNIRDFIIMSYGLTPEIVEAGYNTDFATTVVAKNLLLAKRVTQLQNIFNPQVADHIRKIAANDKMLHNLLLSIIKGNIKEIKKAIKAQAKDENNTNISKLKDDDLIEYILFTIIEDLDVYLPSPELNEAQAMKEAFTTYKESIDEYIELMLSPDSFPEELVGDVANRLDTIKAAIKSALLKKWMSDNNYLSDINKLFVLDDKGKPAYDALDEFRVMMNNMIETIIPFLETATKDKSKIDERLTKLNNAEEEELSDDVIEPEEPELEDPAEEPVEEPIENLDDDSETLV